MNPLAMLLFALLSVVALGGCSEEQTASMKERADAITEEAKARAGTLKESASGMIGAAADSTAELPEADPTDGEAESDGTKDAAQADGVSDNAQEAPRPFRVRSVTMTGQLDNVGGPVGEKTVFSASDPTVYVSIDVENLRAGTKLEASWHRDGNKVDESTPAIPNQDYDSVHVWFSTTYAKVSTPGSYEVQIYVDGKLTTTGQFTVK